MIGLNNPPVVNVRGEFKTVEVSGAPGHTNWFDAINISGSSGKIACIIGRTLTTNAELRLTVDSEVSGLLTLQIGEIECVNIMPGGGPLAIAGQTDIVFINFEYKNDFRVEVKASNGANQLMCYIYFYDDS